MENIYKNFVESENIERARFTDFQYYNNRFLNGRQKSTKAAQYDLKMVISDKITGYTIQKLHGVDFQLSDTFIILSTYKVEVHLVLDEEDKGKILAFDVSRNSWYPSDNTANGKVYKAFNRTFEPWDGSDSLYDVEVINYAGNKAFRLMKNGSWKLNADPLEIHTGANGTIDNKMQGNIVSDVMIHSGNTNKKTITDQGNLEDLYCCFGFVPKAAIKPSIIDAKKTLLKADYASARSHDEYNSVINQILKWKKLFNAQLKVQVVKRHDVKKSIIVNTSGIFTE